MYVLYMYVCMYQCGVSVSVCVLVCVYVGRYVPRRERLPDVRFITVLRALQIGVCV